MAFCDSEGETEDGGLGGGCRIYPFLSVCIRINVSEKTIIPGKTGIMDCSVYPNKVML